MDGYCISTAATNPCPSDYFPIDDLLDFSNEDLFSSSSSSSSSSSTDLPPPPPPPDHRFNTSITNITNANYPAHSVDFTDHLSLPSDDVAELEWLSRFVDDSFTDLPNNCLTINIPSDQTPSPTTSKSRTKRSRQPNHRQQEPSPRVAEEGGGEVRRCTHCASEKTPQWRTGPLGPKTLCNACGVRFKSGRLVPEYRPASSPTFVFTQHSNSHRKVLELRRQKELLKQHQHNFGVR